MGKVLRSPYRKALSRDQLTESKACYRGPTWLAVKPRDDKRSDGEKLKLMLVVDQVNQVNQSVKSVNPQSTPYCYPKYRTVRRNRRTGLGALFPTGQSKRRTSNKLLLSPTPHITSSIGRRSRGRRSRYVVPMLQRIVLLTPYAPFLTALM